MRSIRVLVSALALVFGPAAVALGISFVEFDGPGFQLLIGESHAVRSGLTGPGDFPHVTGDEEVDLRIWELAVSRGYDTVALADTDSLVANDGVLMQSEMVDAWEALQAAAADDGIALGIVSGYRSIEGQRALFLSGLSGTSDAAVLSRLERAAPPGASRHHTGYALDIRNPGWPGSFGTSPAFGWISADNYYQAKRFGFVPSYPPDAVGFGPDPEPWEYVYVGLDVIAGDLHFADVPADHFAHRSVDWMVENGHTNGCRPFLFCTDDESTRGEVAAFFKRVLEPTLGQPAAVKEFADAEEHLFESAIEWMGGHGISLGCDPPHYENFCPDRDLTRGEVSALLKRAVGHLVIVDPAKIDPSRFVDTQGSVFVNSVAWLAATGITSGCNPPTNDRFCPTSNMSRAELAVFLKRVADRVG